MRTTTTDAVEVPRHVIDVVIGVYAQAAMQGRDFDPEVADALRAIVDRDLPAGRTPGTVRLDAEHAWHLADCGDAIDAFGLDEEDPTIWDHPAVVAQQTLADAVDDQAPHVASRLNATLETTATTHSSTNH